MVDLIGYIAASLTTFSFVPQVLHTIKTRDTSGISLGMYCILVIGIFLWLVYGILKGDVMLLGIPSLSNEKCTKTFLFGTSSSSQEPVGT